MIDSDEARLEITREDHVMVLTMVREAKRNAVDRRMADAIDSALSDLDEDDDLWVGVLSGSQSIFSAGSDLPLALCAPGHQTSEQDAGLHWLRRQERLHRLFDVAIGEPPQDRFVAIAARGDKSVLAAPDGVDGGGSVGEVGVPWDDDVRRGE